MNVKEVSSWNTTVNGMESLSYIYFDDEFIIWMVKEDVYKA